MYMHTLGDPQAFKTYHFIIFESSWVRAAADNIPTSIVSNSHFGKRPVARDMTIFSFYFLSHVTNYIFSDL